MKLQILIPMLFAGACTALALPAEKPNFLIFIGDDHGIEHSSAYGSPEFKTPHMQQFADQGIKFMNAYVASPSCGPSRAALCTGLMPYRNGIVGNHEAVLKPGVESLIPRLINQGYEVVFIGKISHGSAKHHDAYQPKEVVNLGRIPHKDFKLKKLQTYLKQRDATKPLALFVGFTDTHTPWPDKKSVRIPLDEVRIPERIYETPEARVEMSRYIQGAENIDRKIGVTLKMYDRFVKNKNTLTVYTSDHGMPWPFGKWSLYEMGIRCPFIATWPGKIKAGTTTDAWVSWVDIFPTIIDIAGGSTPKDIDGRSFADVLLGKNHQHRDVIFATHKGANDNNIYPCRSVRVGDYKLIYNLHPEFYNSTPTDRESQKIGHKGMHWPAYREVAKTNEAAAAFLVDYHSNPEIELYNVVKDPYEKNNLAASPEYAQKVKTLKGLIDQRMIEVDDDRSLSGTPLLLSEHPIPSPRSN